MTIRSLFLNFRVGFLLLILAFNEGEVVRAQQTAAGSGNADNAAASPSSAGASTSVVGQTAPTTAPSTGATVNGGISLPSNSITPGDTSLQVAPPSVTLPTPALPVLPSVAEPTPAPSLPPATPVATPPPVFNPPSGTALNLPSAQPAGNPDYASAALGLPNMKLDDSAATNGPVGLGQLFDWAKKLRFQLALRGGYNSNVNNTHTNAIGSIFGNVNGGVGYRFGDPRLKINLDLTGGLTQYYNSKISQPFQGTIGLALGVEYRYNPRLVLTFSSSSSFQQQPNVSLAGTSANSANSSYYYTANSLAAAYQWSDLFTSVTRINETANYYPSNRSAQGFNQPGLTQTFRYLVKPTTTAVFDYNTYLYTYANPGIGSWGNTVDIGFDHTFNPKFFWNFRLGAELISFQNSLTGNGEQLGPYVDSTLSWAFGHASTLNWVAHLGSQPSSQQNVSYSEAFRTGLNYSQGLFSKMTLNAGIYYLLSDFKNAPLGVNGSTISYNQTNIQGNVSLTYTLNRIIDLSLGYQYTSSMSPAVPSQEYNTGVTYLQVRAGF